jgi:hypothetical protein
VIGIPSILFEKRVAMSDLYSRERAVFIAANHEFVVMMVVRFCRFQNCFDGLKKLFDFCKMVFREESCKPENKSLVLSELEKALEEFRGNDLPILHSILQEAEDLLSGKESSLTDKERRGVEDASNNITQSIANVERGIDIVTNFITTQRALLGQ